MLADLARTPSRLSFVAFVLVVSAAVPAMADQALEPGLLRLERFIDRLETLTANFEQQVFNRELVLLESSTGKLSLQKPGRFRWDYEQPFERLVMADGERVWLYEADLEQLTVQRLGEGLGETPAALLTGAVSIAEQFDFLGASQLEELSWLRLGPRDDAADFAEIRLAFNDESLVGLELADRLGQTTRIFFSDIQLNTPLPDNVFSFQAPPGTDVIGEDEL